MKNDSNYRLTLTIFLCLPLVNTLTFAQAAPEKTIQAANELAVTVKEVGPGGQEGPLQIACYLKHKPTVGQGDRGSHQFRPTYGWNYQVASQWRIFRWR
jgi:hypothetical protein